MENISDKKEVITKMRPDPDFQYLARRAGVLTEEGVPLALNLRRDPGEIPGFYAEEHGE